MKPCKKNRKLIAWLTLDQLDAGPEARLRAHLADCDGCQAYFEELSKIAGLLGESKSESNVQASELFHQRLVRKLRTVERKSGPREFAHQCLGALSNRRVALPAIATALLILVASLAVMRPGRESLPRRISGDLVSTTTTPGDFEPTLSNYKILANQSFDRLEEVLSEQGSKSLAPTPIYTASTLPLAMGAD